MLPKYVSDFRYVAPVAFKVLFEIRALQGRLESKGQISHFLTHMKLGEGWRKCPSRFFIETYDHQRVISHISSVYH